MCDPTALLFKKCTLLFIYLHVWVSLSVLVCMCICMCMQMSGRPEEGSRSPAAGVRVEWEFQKSEAQALFMAELSLEP